MKSGDDGAGKQPSNGGNERRVNRLIGLANTRGFVTIGELRAALPEAASEPLITDVVKQLFELGIDIVDEQQADDGRKSEPADASGIEHLRRFVMLTLARLTDRERRMLEQRFGIDPDKGEALEEVERHFSATRERIRAIETKALRKLKPRRPPEEPEC